MHSGTGALLTLLAALLAADALQPPSPHRWRRHHVRFADEAPDAAEAADAPAEPPAEEKVDAMTYVFGKPGELQGDMARMGTSPRRLALFGLLGLFIALAGDLFRLTSTLLRIAPGGVQDAARRARLDTYYPIGDFKRYIDDEYRFEVRYPEMWLADQAIYVSRMQARTGAGAVDAEALLRSRKQKGPAALAGFGPPGGGKVPIFVPKNGNARPPRPRAGRESIDADQLMSVNLAASATGAVDPAPAF